MVLYWGKKTNDNHAVACNRVLWPLNNLSVLQVNELMCSDFELKVINEKCHLFSVKLSWFFSLSLSPISFLTYTLCVSICSRLLVLFQLCTKRCQIKNKTAERKNPHRQNQVTILFMRCAISLCHGTGYVSRFDNKYHRRWINYVYTLALLCIYTDCVKHK